MDLEIQACAAERALQELQQAVQPRAGASSGVAEKQAQIAACERLAQRVKNTLESYRLELRSLPREEQAEHQHRIRGLEEGFKQAKAQIEWKRLDTEAAASAIAGPSGGGAADLEAGSSGPMTLEQAVATSDKIQDESKASISRSLGMVLQAEQVGIITLQKMHEQEEQMARIAEDVEDVKANIARGKKLVSQIAKGAARDRCTQALCVLITVAILIMLTLAVIGRDGGELNMPEGVRQVGRQG